MGAAAKRLTPRPRSRMLQAPEWLPSQRRMSAAASSAIISATQRRRGACLDRLSDPPAAQHHAGVTINRDGDYLCSIPTL